MQSLFFFILSRRVRLFPKTVQQKKQALKDCCFFCYFNGFLLIFPAFLGYVFGVGAIFSISISLCCSCKRNFHVQYFDQHRHPVFAKPLLLLLLLSAASGPFTLPTCRLLSQNGNNILKACPPNCNCTRYTQIKLFSILWVLPAIFCSAAHMLHFAKTMHL